MFYQANAVDVALRKESVDRNEHAKPAEQAKAVALRKESVDRNLQKLAEAIKPSVALRKESVDRNKIRIAPVNSIIVALRKESVDRNNRNNGKIKQSNKVALRKESVDRNYIIKITRIAPRRSLSARRAWIEIWSAVLTELLILCRSPQGERG